MYIIKLLAGALFLGACLGSVLALVFLLVPETKYQHGTVKLLNLENAHIIELPRDEVYDHPDEY